MAKVKEEEEKRKPFNEMSFKELDRQALIDHAKSLGGKTALEALIYLKELSEKVPYTREELKRKRKRKKDKTTGKMIETDIPKYTDKEIDELIEKEEGAPKYSMFELKQLYCKTYWTEILPEGKKKETSFTDMIAAAMAELQAANKK